MTNLTINGTAISTLGFQLKRIDGHKAAGEPKEVQSVRDDYSSKNFYIGTFKQASPEVSIDMFGEFATIQAADAALYTLYGWLVQPGAHAFVHTNGSSTISFTGIMHKGTTVEYNRKGAGIVYSVKLKILRAS